MIDEEGASRLSEAAKETRDKARLNCVAREGADDRSADAAQHA